MSNAMDYMDWRGDVPFAGSPFNEIDNIILAMSTFVDFTGIVPEALDAAPIGFEIAMKRFAAVSDERNYLGAIIPAGLLDVARKAVTCERYRTMKLIGYVNRIDEDKEMQFSALTFILPDDTFYVAFRGTDDTIVGWKEDLNLGFKTPVPAHICAQEYIEDAAASLDGGIRIGGHSKGGNVSMWAASHCADCVQSRIVRVYNNDGPGFMPEVLSEPGFRAVADRIITFIPQSSIVGTLLEQSPICQIIKSTQSGIMQHDPLSWEVMGTRFVYLEKRSRFGERSDEAFKSWVFSMSPEEKVKLADVLFSVIDSTGAKTLTDLNDAKLKSISVIMKSLHDLDKESRTMMAHTMLRLLGGMRETPKQSKAIALGDSEKPAEPEKRARMSGGQDEPVQISDGQVQFKITVPDISELVSPAKKTAVQKPRKPAAKKTADKPKPDEKKITEK